MTDRDPTPAEPANPGSNQPTDAAPLDRVVDDLDARQSSSDWATDEMSRGRTAEEVAGELMAHGWGEEDAAEMAESARRATRHLRGVITREQVAAQYTARYRKATALRWFSVFPSISSLWRLLNSLGGLRRAGRTAPGENPNQPPPGEISQKK